MTELAVRTRGVGKRYKLGQLQAGYSLLSETITERLRGRRPGRREEFWALRDVDFEVARGESFGIIGHNGAGKSTLLKILARVTPPTTGEITLHGRVGALLEVGTGFHGELSGRENIYLNGAILGMRRSEIAAKFDEIVAFAEVERFIDTPVKRYSSGMYLRLAFAVAAHLEPEVLVIDEVLSVGDLAFQEKCLGRMEEVAGEGRTVLFVSHNLTAVQKLCERSLLLSGGRMVTQGPTVEVVSAYVQSARRESAILLGDRTDRMGSGRLRFVEIAFESEGRRIDSPATGQDFGVALTYETADGRPLRNVNFALSVNTVLGELMLHLQSSTTGMFFRELPPTGVVSCSIPHCPLPAGQYMLNVLADTGPEILDWVQRAGELTVRDGDYFGSGRSQPASHRAVLIEHDWALDESRDSLGADASASRIA